jgi:xylulose-5-phosphate/fructose-6-phosphate phosphoketolase
MAGLLFGRKSHVGRTRFDIHGYVEEGTTTTPWSMLRLNHCSRYDLADLAVQHVASSNPLHPVAPRAHLLSANWRHELRKHDRFTREHGVDPDWCGEIPALKEGRA